MRTLPGFLGKVRCGLFSDAPLLCDSLELRLQSFDLRAVILLLHSLLGRDAVLLNSGVQAMRRYSQSLSNVPDRKPEFGNLSNCLDLEFFGE
jgi:hypothetical protein